MSAAPTLPFVPEEEYLRSTYEPECEYVDGLLLPKPMPTLMHSRLQAFLVALLVREEEEFGIRVYVELRMKVADGRFRLPDVAVYTSPVSGRAPTQAPWLTIEIVSEGELWHDLKSKINDHHLMGVPNILVADPKAREVLAAGGDGLLHQLPNPLLVTLTLPNGKTLTIDFDHLFAQL